MFSLPNHSKRIYSYFFLIITVAIWGIATPVIKATETQIPPMTFLMVRFWISALIALPFAIHILSKNKINRTRWKHLLISSTLGHVIALSLIFLGLSKTTAVEGSLLTVFSPLLTTALGVILLKEIVSKKKIEGTLIAFTGAIILIIAPVINGSIFNGGRMQLIGNILFFLGVLMDSFYVIYSKKYIVQDKITKPFVQIIISFIFAAIVFTPLGLIEQAKIYRNTLRSEPNYELCREYQKDRKIIEEKIPCTQKDCGTNLTDYTVCKNSAKFIPYLINNLKDYFSAPTIYGILYMAIFSGLLAYFLFSLGLKKIEAGEASLFYYLQPAFGIPVAVIFLNESLSPAFVVGTIIIIVGIFLAERKR